LSFRKSGEMQSHYIRPIIIAAYAAIASYCLLSVIFGPAGGIAYRGLETNRGVMADNIESLRAKNEALRGELSAIRTDADRVEREARALGYLAAGETALIVPNGFIAPETKAFDPGKIVRKVDVVPLTDATIKAIALMLGMMSLIAGFALEFRKTPLLKGMPSDFSASARRHASAPR
jgi:hypothetical protein